MTKARIAIVEDEGVVALVLKKYMEASGHEVAFIAASGAEALDQIARHLPDLVLMDIRLKGSMDGVEVAARIKDAYHVPVIYLTAYSDERTLERARLTEPFGYIPKPIEERTLQTTVEMALHKAAMQAQLRQAKEKLETVLRSIGDGVIVSDSAGVVEYLNPAAERLLQVASHSVQGTSLEQRFDIIDSKTARPVSLPMDGALRGETVSLADISLLTNDGERLPVEINLSPLLDESGRPQGLVLVFRDVTERQKIRQLIDRELEEATKLHRSLLPPNHAEINGIRMSWLFHSASFGAGDLFDFFRIDDAHAGVYIFDVIGHGISAATLSLLLHRFLSPEPESGRTLASPVVDALSPTEVVTTLNSRFYSSVNQQFVSLLYGTIDTTTGRTRLVRAGHDYPLVQKSDGSVSARRSEGIAIGITPNPKIAEYEILLEPGDRLFLYTDGLVECKNPGLSQYGVERLISLIESTRKAELPQAVDTIDRSVREWRGRRDFEDDVSLLALQMK